MISLVSLLRSVVVLDFFSRCDARRSRLTTQYGIFFSATLGVLEPNLFLNLNIIFCIVSGTS